MTYARRLVRALIRRLIRYLGMVCRILSLVLRRYYGGLRLILRNTEVGIIILRCLLGRWFGLRVICLRRRRFLLNFVAWARVLRLVGAYGRLVVRFLLIPCVFRVSLVGVDES